MKLLAAVFPGQGSQYQGMAHKLISNWPKGEAYLHKADKISGQNISWLCLQAPQEELNDTINAQPAILTMDYLYWRWWLESGGCLPKYVAGHSLGEFAALLAAEAIDFPTALKLVTCRAKLMKQAARGRFGGMSAILGLSEEVIKEKISAFGSKVVIANYNSPSQIVISGEKNPLAKAEQLLKQSGAKKVVRLRVSGSFHSPAMQEAEKHFLIELEKAPISKAKIPVVCNVSAQVVEKPEDIKEALGKQITSPVLWQQSLQYMSKNGVNVFVEIGPGKVLKSLAKSTIRQSDCYSLDEDKYLARKTNFDFS